MQPELLTTRHPLYAEAEALMEQAFPPDERRPKEKQRYVTDHDPRFRPCALVRDGEFIGLLTYWELDGLIYVEHLATRPELRGGGLGAAALEALKAKAGGVPIVLEVEPPADELTRRRIGFYQRQGFTLWADSPYLQPAYAPGQGTPSLLLMVCGHLDEKADFDRVRRTLHCGPYGLGVPLLELPASGSPLHEETVSVRHLSTGYTDSRHPVTVASDVNASLRSGELTCLLGANGAGKSTLLRTLAAFQPPLGGEVYILGRRIGDYTSRELARLVSVVLTEKPALRGMTVTELVGMGRTPYTGFFGGLDATDRARVREALDRVGITHLADRHVHTLSDGERQKVMIAKALAQQTPIVLLDEPTAFLDYPGKVDMMHLLHTLARDTGKTILLSTHDLDLALRLADRLWLLERGGAVHIGTPEDLALDGTLPRFFAADGMAFDASQGLFRPVLSGTTPVRLTGDAACFGLLTKALMRTGRRATTEEPAPERVEAVRRDGSFRFLLHRPDAPMQECPTVEALLDALGPAPES